MYHYSIEPMFEHRNKAIGDPSARFKIVRVDAPASIVDWSKGETVVENLTSEEAPQKLSEITEDAK